MIEPPRLSEEAIIATLQTHYSISTRALTFLPLGMDSATSVYRVQTVGGADYFLKIRAHKGFSVPSLAVPRYLCDHGVPHVFGPIPTRSQALWVDVADFALILYPFIEGHVGGRVTLTDDHWRAFGALMRQIHNLQLPPDLLQILPCETFTPSRRNVIPDLEDAVKRQRGSTPVEREFSAFWQTREEEIRMLVDRTDALAHRLRHTSAPQHLCHADMHPWNLLIDTTQHLWLVDWDETILARKERDLMFIVGGIGGDRIGQHETNCFFEGYGETVLDPIALAYYRYAWAVQDIAAFGEQILLSPHLGEETRREALRWFKGLFAPGSIVSIALASDLD